MSTKSIDPTLYCDIVVEFPFEPLIPENTV